MDSTEEWRRIARREDVLHSILSWPGMEGRWSEEAFYETGRSDWADFLRHWEHYDSGLGGRCLEVGCGAGRLTAQLAGRFDEVVALDVSEEMISRAREASPDNVSFLRVDGTSIVLGDAEFDAAFSVHALQHLDGYRELSAYIAELRRLLRPGATAMLHIWLSSTPPAGLKRLRHQLSIRRGRRDLRRGRRPGAVGMQVYRPEQIHALLEAAGFSEIELRVIPVRSNGFHHHFWFARVPTGERPAQSSSFSTR